MTEELPPPPAAVRRPVSRTLHGVTTVDEYAWLRDRDDPAVLAHLDAENDHTEVVLAPIEDLRADLFAELRARVQEDDTTVPVPYGDWEYYVRTREGDAYPVRCRRPRGGGDEQVLLDENVLSEGHDHLAVGDVAVSPDHSLLAYTVDTDGSERYTLHVRDLATGEDLPDVVELVTYGIAWANDNRTILYTSPDEALRPWQIWRHRLGDEPHLDQLVVEETDERFWLGLWRSRDERHLVISSDSRTTSEVRLVDADHPARTPVLVREREPGVEYAVEPAGDRLVILTNDGAEDFRVVEAALDDEGRPGDWTELVAGAEGTRWDDVDALAGHVVVHGRRNAAPVVLILDRVTGERRELELAGEVLDVSPGPVLEWDTAAYRLVTEAPTDPRRHWTVHLDDGDRRELLRTDPAPGVDPDAYVDERHWATAADGTRIPISLSRHVDTPLDGTAPVVIRAYGAYEISSDPGFSVSRLSLLDRGVVVAIAHVRGGGELGRRWWTDGSMANKPNTFSDTVAVAEHLRDAGLVDGDRMGLIGGSAGGLLVGATLNLRPELFRVAVAAVPFVDIVSTLLDESLPLTVTEWEEWGNPAVADEHAVIASYSPYENVREGERYPAVLATAGWNDPRVSYWEPAKWVLRLRERATGGPFLLHTELGAGHAGPSGRYDAWREIAMLHAFLLHHLI